MGGRGFPLVVGIVVSLLCAACGTHASSGPLSFTDDLHHKVSLDHPATRIVSLGPSDTEMVLALGLKKDLVGADKASFQYLPAPYPTMLKQGVAQVGDASSTPNIEAITRLKPDLVLAVYSAPYLKKLESLGLKVAVLDPTNIASIEQDVITLGTATGQVAVAKQLDAVIKKDVGAVRQAAKAAGGKPSVFVELSPKLYTVGPGSFIDALITSAGGRNVVDGIAHKPYPQVTSAQVIRANPQVIILQDQGFGGALQSMTKRPGWSAISAVKHRRVVGINPDLLSDPGPSVVYGLKALALALHPGLTIPGFTALPSK